MSRNRGGKILAHAPSLPRRIFHFLRPGFSLLFPLQVSEGGRAPTGAGADRRTLWPASRLGRSAVRRRSPANDAGRRASRRSTAAFARRGYSVSPVPGRASWVLGLSALAQSSELLAARS